ncbi:MAG: YlmC/YmxH family sporulation protein [Peptococcaceae bacterium]|nr:YlmC/YmxH family sporulation protein [Peptococcaceae bacterium]
MLKVTDLSSRDIINIVDGKRLGPIKDMHIDPNSGTVNAIVLQSGKKLIGIFGFGKDIIIPWNRIKKIGVDAVLVEMYPGEEVAHQDGA